MADEIERMSGRRRRTTRVAAGAALLLLACACAVTINRTVVPPPSQGGIGGELISRQIDDHTWRIYWADETYFEDKQTEEDYFLFRVAQMTVEKGFDWFSISGQHAQMFSGVAPADVLGTYDARQVMKYVAPRVQAARATPPGPGGPNENARSDDGGTGT